MKHLVYTSARRGIDSNYPGFCTVAATPGIPPQIRKSIENLSGYSSEGGESGAYPNYSHMKLRTREGVRHLISRISPCPPDYSGRSNTIAHHILFETAEEDLFDPLSYIMPDVRFYENWVEEPRALEDLDISTRSIPEPRPCHAWKEFTGDSGNAGVVWSKLRDQTETVLVLFPARADRLTLLRELLALVPKAARTQITFSTAPGADHSSMTECRLRLRIDCPESRRECNECRGATILDFTAETIAEGSSDVACARDGVAFNVAEKVRQDPIVPFEIRVASSPSAPIPFASTMTARRQQRHNSDRIEPSLSESGSLFRRALSIMAAFVLGIAVTFVIRAVIPAETAEVGQSDSAAQIATPQHLPETNPSNVDADSEKNQKSELERKLGDAKKENQTLAGKNEELENTINELRKNIQLLDTQIKEASQGQTQTVPPSSSAPSETPRPEPRTQQTKTEVTPLQLSIGSGLPEPYKNYAPMSKDAIGIALHEVKFNESATIELESALSAYELKSKDGFKVELHHKHPSKSSTQRLLTYSLLGGDVAELRIERDPSVDAVRAESVGIKLMNEHGQVVRVRMRPMMKVVKCELKAAGTGIWSAEIQQSDKDHVNAILGSLGNPITKEILCGPNRRFVYKITLGKDQTKPMLIVEYQLPNSVSEDKRPSIESLSNTLDRLKRTGEGTDGNTSMTKNDFMKSITPDIDSMIQHLNVITDVIPATTALHTSVGPDREWIIQSKSADRALMIGLSEDGR